MDSMFQKNIISVRNPYFTGRQSELDQLFRGFSKGARTAVIYGAAAIGKSQLAMEFLYRNSNLFPGGFAIHYAHSGLPIDALWSHTINKDVPKKRCVLLVNDAETIDSSSVRSLRDLLYRFPNLNVILTSRRKLGAPFKSDLSLNLSPLTIEESAALLGRILGEVPLDQVKRLHEIAGGHPLVVQLAAQQIEAGVITWEEFYERLRGFEYSGILGPDGRPLHSGTAEERRIIIDITEVNDELLQIIQSKPALLYSVAPRKFEEIVAEIMSRMGYDVTLTPATGDGGFDLFAAKNDGLGTFLFLVECKRYVPPNKVGVEVVRALHGVVQSKKATAGVVATTSFFTSGAKAFQQEVAYQLHLNDYLDLQRWLNQIWH